MILMIVKAIANCFSVFLFMIFIRCLLTWFPNVNWNNPILNGLKSATDLYLNLFKKIIPPVGPFDISPMVACFVLIFLQNIVIYTAVFLLRILGIK